MDFHMQSHCIQRRLCFSQRNVRWYRRGIVSCLYWWFCVQCSAYVGRDKLTIMYSMHFINKRWCGRNYITDMGERLVRANHELPMHINPIQTEFKTYFICGHGVSFQSHWISTIRIWFGAHEGWLQMHAESVYTNTMEWMNVTEFARDFVCVAVVSVHWIYVPNVSPRAEVSKHGLRLVMVVPRSSFPPVALVDIVCLAAFQMKLVEEVTAEITRFLWKCASSPRATVRSFHFLSKQALNFNCTNINERFSNG